MYFFKLDDVVNDKIENRINFFSDLNWYFIFYLFLLILIYLFIFLFNIIIIN
jgi:hypothetical protein